MLATICNSLKIWESAVNPLYESYLSENRQSGPAVTLIDLRAVKLRTAYVFLLTSSLAMCASRFIGRNLLIGRAAYLGSLAQIGGSLVTAYVYYRYENRRAQRTIDACIVEQFQKESVPMLAINYVAKHLASRQELFRAYPDAINKIISLGLDRGVDEIFNLVIDVHSDQKKKLSVKDVKEVFKGTAESISHALSKEVISTEGFDEDDLLECWDLVKRGLDEGAVDIFLSKISTEPCLVELKNSKPQFLLESIRDFVNYPQSYSVKNIYKLLEYGAWIDLDTPIQEVLESTEEPTEAALSVQKALQNYPRLLQALDQAYKKNNKIVLIGSSDSNDVDAFKNNYFHEPALTQRICKDSELLDRLIDENVDLDQQDTGGETALDQFLDDGSLGWEDINDESWNNFEILAARLFPTMPAPIKHHYFVKALENGNSVYALHLLNKNFIKVNEFDERQQFSCWVACKSEELVRELFKRGFDIEAKDENDFTPLLKIASVNARRFSYPFFRSQFLKVLIELEANKNATVQMPGKQDPQTTVSKSALDLLDDEDLGSFEILAAYLFPTMPVPIKHHYFVKALEKGNFAYVLHLLDKNFIKVGEFDKRQQSSCWVACKSEKLVRELFKRGFDIEAKDENGFTPLLKIASANARGFSYPFCRSHFLEVLIELGANKNATVQMLDKQDPQTTVSKSALNLLEGLIDPNYRSEDLENSIKLFQPN